MREHRPVLVTNTTPLIALVAATGSLEKEAEHLSAAAGGLSGEKVKA